MKPAPSASYFYRIAMTSELCNAATTVEQFIKLHPAKFICYTEFMKFLNEIY